MFLNISKWLKSLSQTINSAKANQSAYSKQSDCIAIVDTVISLKRRGRVRFQGSSWPASCEHNFTFNPGERVRVIGRSNITLIVDSLPQ
jgi:membrane protein implicated in regulation of membrane protease activity